MERQSCTVEKAGKDTQAEKLINLEKEVKENIRNYIEGNYNKYLLRQVHQSLL